MAARRSATVQNRLPAHVQITFPLDPVGCWSARTPGFYITEGHGTQTECGDLATAKQKCEAAADCGGIANQYNICGGEWRVSHGGPTLVAGSVATFAVYTLDRTCYDSEPHGASRFQPPLAVIELAPLLGPMLFCSMIAESKDHSQSGRSGYLGGLSSQHGLCRCQRNAPGHVLCLRGLHGDSVA